MLASKNIDTVLFIQLLTASVHLSDTLATSNTSINQP